MVTMRDVAMAAGVSTATVSHVLNSTRKVNAETAEAVRRAISRSGYVNDSVARAMRTGSTRTIGLAMSAISNPYFGEVVHAIEEHLTELDYSLLLVDTHDDEPHERRAIGELLRHRPAGIILAPSAAPAHALSLIAARDVPIVSVDRVLPGVDSVSVEGRQATETLVAHLISLGHQRIAMVSGRSGLATTNERIAGYRDAMEQAMLSISADLLLVGDSRGSAARRVVAEAMARPDRPTALMVGNNQMTIGAMQALRDCGLSVPQDVALVAFDDFPWSDLFSPRLTTVAQPESDMAKKAVSMLMERLTDPAGPPRTVRLTPTLHHRDSCGCGQPEAELATPQGHRP